MGKEKLLIDLKTLTSKTGNSIFMLPNQMDNKVELKKWKDRFLEIADPTEYLFGISTCGDYELYESIKSKSRILRKHLERWHRELKIKLRSEALHTIVSDIKSKSKTSISSAKYIEEKFLKEDSVGKPKKSRAQEKKIDKDLLWDSIKGSYKEATHGAN